MLSYESLDYDECASSIAAAEKLSQSANYKRARNFANWGVYSVVGMVTGTAAFAIAVCVGWLSELKFNTTSYFLLDSSLGRATWQARILAYAVFASFSVGFVLIATFLVAIVEPAAGGSGIPEIKGYLNGTNYKRLLYLKTLIVKCIGVLFSVSGGLTVGKEGPLVHTGSGLGAIVSHVPDIPVPCSGGKTIAIARGALATSFRNDRDKRDFVSGGCAAGVGAAFGAPIGGVLFSLEEASSFWSLPLTWKVFFCSMTSTFTLALWKSFSASVTQSESGSALNAPGLITFGKFKDSAYHVWELPIFAAMGVFGGLAGALFNVINVKICHLRRDLLGPRPGDSELGTKCWKRPLSKKLARMAEALTIALLTATLQFWVPALPIFECKANEALLPTGAPTAAPAAALYAQSNASYPSYAAHAVSEAPSGGEGGGEPSTLAQYTCPDGFHNDMASLFFQPSEAVIKGIFHNPGDTQTFALVIYYVCIFFLAVVTYGIAVPSGLFVPAILIGSCMGRLVGQLLHAIPEIDGADVFGTTGTYALIGATAMLGGVTRMTISLTVILLETTNEIQCVTPQVYDCVPTSPRSHRFSSSLLISLTPSRYLLPIMLTLMVSKWVGDFFNISLYDLHVELKCIPFVEANPPLSLQGKCAKDVMVTPVVSLAARVTVRDVLPLLKETTHNGFPIVDDDGRCVGLILRNQIVVMLQKRAFAEASAGDAEGGGYAAPILGASEAVLTGSPQEGTSGSGGAASSTLSTSDFATTLSSRVFELDTAEEEDGEGAMLELPKDLTSADMLKVLDLEPYYNRSPYMVQDCWPLARVYRLYRCMGVRHLPVVDRQCRLVGILSRKELQTDFTVDLS